MNMEDIEDIEDIVRRHDAYQFEIKLEHDFKNDKKEERYLVETFFFLPTNLDVNAHTYSKDQFYKDLLLYLRFKTPVFSLKSLTDPGNRRSPLSKIAAQCEEFLRAPSPRRTRGLEYEIKLFGCVLKSALRDHGQTIEKVFRESGKGGLEAKALPLLDEYIAGSRRAAALFHSFRDRLTAPSIPKRLQSTYLFTDEYVSLLLEGRTHLLLQSLYKMPERPFLKKPMEELVELAREQMDHRRAMNYPSLVREGGENEVFVFRLSVLKKFVASVLHLSVRTTAAGRGWEEFAMAIGAGVAMIFATSIAFYYQRLYGTLSLSFFAALVVSYMLKDRLKALSQGYFHKIFSAVHLFDQSIALYDPFTGEKIGLCLEGFHFSKDDRIDPVVTRLRNREHITEIENEWRSEQIIHYVKEIVLYPRRLLENESRMTGVADIARFNVRNFLLKMDEPETDVFTVKDGRSVALRGTRVYSVNVVIKFSSSRGARYERIRLLLTRNGIKRVEPVTGETVPAAS